MSIALTYKGEPVLAYLLKAGTSKALAGAATETWVIRELDNTPICQIDLFKSKRTSAEVRVLWNAWTGNFVRAEQRKLAEDLASARNFAGGTFIPENP